MDTDVLSWSPAWPVALEIEPSVVLSVWQYVTCVAVPATKYIWEMNTETV